MTETCVKKDLHLPKGNVQMLLIPSKYFYHPIVITVLLQLLDVSHPTTRPSEPVALRAVSSPHCSSPSTPLTAPQRTPQ